MRERRRTRQSFQGFAGITPEAHEADDERDDDEDSDETEAPGHDAVRDDRIEITSRRGREQRLATENEDRGEERADDCESKKDG